jgi:hypothetical protein
MNLIKNNFSECRERFNNIILKKLIKNKPIFNIVKINKFWILK